MALTPTEEAQTRQLIAVSPQTLNLAASEPTIISKLGATKVNLSQLPAASALGDADLLLVRQGTEDRAIAASIIKAASTVADASTTAKGIARVATASEVDAGTTANLIVDPIGVASVRGRYSSSSTITANTTFTISDAGKAININSASATSHNLPAASAYASGKTISFSNTGAGIATFNRAGSDTITGGQLLAATAIPLNQQECITLVSDGASKWYVAASNVTFFGPPQTWQNFTGSRSFGTTYTNSTGRSIIISVQPSTSADMSISVNGVTMAAAGPFNTTVQALIPNGYTYLVSSTSSIFRWSELR